MKSKTKEFGPKKGLPEKKQVDFGATKDHVSNESIPIVHWYELILNGSMKNHKISKIIFKILSFENRNTINIQSDFRGHCSSCETSYNN